MEEQELSPLTVFTLSVILTIVMALAGASALHLLGIAMFGWQTALAVGLLIAIARMIAREGKSEIEIVQDQSDENDK